MDSANWTKGRQNPNKWRLTAIASVLLFKDQLQLFLYSHKQDLFER